MNERIQTEMVSRRKALSLLGLGAALGFTLSSALEPLEAEAQEAAPATPAPAATGTHGMQRRSARRTTRHQRRPPRRTSSDTIGDPSAFNVRSRDLTDSEVHMRSANHAMRETADEKKRRRRKYPATAESTGKHLVMTELLRRGFEAELAGASYEKHDMLVRVGGSRPKPIRIKTVHSAPWYVRWDLFAKRADQVTVYVLLWAETEVPTRFFVVNNSDLAGQFRQPPTWKAFGFIDVKSVEKYEDNWDILM